MTRALAVLCLAVALAAPAAAAPSFDCAKSRTAAEKQICTPETGLAWFDRQVAHLFKLAKAEPNADRAALTNDQRTFLDRRNACGSNVACIEMEYRARAKALGAKLSIYEAFAEYRRNPGGELWIARYGATGAAKIYAQNDNEHLCMFETDDALIGGKGVVRFRGKNENACRMDIEPDGDDMRVDAKGCERYCGVGAQMNGLYSRVP
jgi:uncharacterized protein